MKQVENYGTKLSELKRQAQKDRTLCNVLQTKTGVENKPELQEDFANIAKDVQVKEKVLRELKQRVAQMQGQIQ